MLYSAPSTAGVFMRTGRTSLCTTIALALLVPAPVLAQADLSAIYPGPKRLDVSVAGGLRMSTDWSDLVLLGAVSPASGALEQVLTRELVVRPGTVFDAVATYWEGRYGFRTHVGFAESCLTTGTTCADAAGRATAPGSVDLNAWTYDIGGSIGLVEYRQGTWVWPYVLVGVGGVTYDLERTVGPPLTFVDRSPPRTPDGRLVVSGDAADQVLIAIDELNFETKFALNVGVGTDVRVPLGPASVGIRLEVSDHIHRSPLDVIVLPVDRSRRGGGGTRLDPGYVHNFRVAGGLVLQFGR
jgi:hypothetical protein